MNYKKQNLFIFIFLACLLPSNWLRSNQLLSNLSQSNSLRNNLLQSNSLPSTTCTVSLPIQASSALQELTLTLEKTLSQATKFQPGLRSRTLLIEHQKERELQAISGYLPLISLKASQKLAYYPADSSKRKTVGLEAQQLLFSGNGPLEKQKLAEQDSKISGHEYDRYTHIIRQEVTQAFLTLWPTATEETTHRSTNQTKRSAS